MRKLVIASCLCLAVAVSLCTVFFFHSLLHPKAPDVSGITVAIAVQRLEQKLFALESKEDIGAFLKTHPVFAVQFLGVAAGSDEAMLIDRLHAMIHNTALRDLYHEVQRVFGDFSAIQEQLVSAFRYLHYYYPDFQLPQITTFITGMGTDLYVSPALIVIGLDFFMGTEAKFRPQLPQYILSTYQPAYIVPKILLLLSQRLIEMNATDQTLLADMLYYGKAYYFTKAMLPAVADHIILSYTPEQLAAVNQHQDIVWAHFIEQELLYTTNHLTKNKYISDRPFTAEIGTQCPGNIGRWLGWEILKRYVEKMPEVSLPSLMHHQDSQAILTQSKYRPRK